MTHRPFPNPVRARRQIERHDDETPPTAAAGGAGRVSGSARDLFIDVLYSRGMIRPGEEWVIDANLARYAHELAEQIRADAASRWAPNDKDVYAAGVEDALEGQTRGADLIDPHKSAGRGEEQHG